MKVSAVSLNKTTLGRPRKHSV